MSRSGKLASQGEQRENGRQQILDVIRASEHIARIDIAKATGVSPATVTALTSELLNAGLICEVAPEGNTEGRRGRPRVGLAIRGDAHRIAGIKVARRLISIVITDFAGHEIVHHELALDTGRMPAQVLAQEIHRALKETCKLGGFPIADLSGVGLGLAGMIDAPRNFVYWSSSLEERNIHFAAVLEEILPCPVFLDNDANLVAKAEHLFGAGRNCDNFIVITIEHGVGMGVVIDGKIYRGTKGCGTEFGHTKVQLEGALCQCGQRGCLEAYVGDYALLREANISSGGERYQTLASLFSAAQKGDAMAQSVLDRARRMFALGLANVVNIFDPGKIILAGARLSFDHLYSDRVIDEMQQWIVDVDAPMPEILVHDWGDLMWAKGAAAYAIEEVSALTVKRLAGAAG
ncbi:N-acetylglucosamine repressor [Tritonibacter multivorans]|uniref:N-acetylglucosamine repressor n=1 Tax=Tritonibacter multivorans TaxID=928856 RepID=A0A0P1GDA1_9RHOB|nr:ROK family transcriptional regulator [Tritonibacter multivorans]MDA7419996.1 ROK family transcriptional regulator [Tritonibacter multivorans]CUH79482.1 N-acetylglucosamine repressor [Tritonibacter multivorans]SFC08942.1 Sugar kinase of the NBD/HSP70 family, may contain an N-terminal HTH domain [Tritonibacter multivorans]